MNTTQHNIQRRVEFVRGLVGALQGESQGAALERALPALNQEGYRVVFMVKDEWNVFKKLLFTYTYIFAFITLGLYYRSENWLIIGERMED